MKKYTTPHKALLFLLWIVIACLGRLVPHPANVTPLTSLSVIAGVRFPRWVSVALVLVAMLVSDMLISVVYGYSPIGAWAWFTYPGFVVIALIAPYFCRQLKLKDLVITVFFSALAYWLWTNFGTWFIGGLYPKTMAGLVACYTAGLPFLRSAIIGDVVWMAIIVGLLRMSLPAFLVKKERVTVDE